LNCLTPIPPKLPLAAALLLAFAAAHACPAQATPQSSLPLRPIVVLDPAHGGPETGAHLGEQGGQQAIEKDVDLSLASHLRTALTAAGFAVVSTRDFDPAAVLPPDQRAEIANRQHVLACLVLHATATGSGAHLYVSALAAAPPASPGAHPAFVPVPWDRAQAAAIPQSLQLRARLYEAFQAARISALTGRVSIAPLDNLLCPAVALELAPLPAEGGQPVPVTVAAYQQRVAEAVVSALKVFREAQLASAAHPAGAPQ
jgi:N-acetylmuramoyl-L-alanine amidase